MVNTMLLHNITDIRACLSFIAATAGLGLKMRLSALLVVYLE
jgi:hypothetical protein